jgi:hypothetical protein
MYLQNHQQTNAFRLKWSVHAMIIQLKTPKALEKSWNLQTDSGQMRASQQAIAAPTRVY